MRAGLKMFFLEFGFPRFGVLSCWAFFLEFHSGRRPALLERAGAVVGVRAAAKNQISLAPAASLAASTSSTGLQALTPVKTVAPELPRCRL